MNYSTYKFFTKEGKRLTVIGKLQNEGMLITWIACAKNEPFNKKQGVKLCEEKHPTSQSIIIKEKNFAEFIKFCNQNFYKKLCYNIAIDKQDFGNVTMDVRKTIKGNAEIIIYLKNNKNEQN